MATRSATSPDGTLGALDLPGGSTMTEALDPESRHRISDEELAWVSAHMTDLRRSVDEHRIRKHMLWIGLVVGLVAHVTGFLLVASVTREPIAVLADLLYALG